jgi:hypothetical protein
VGRSGTVGSASCGQDLRHWLVVAPCLARMCVGLFHQQGLLGAVVVPVCTARVVLSAVPGRGLHDAGR